MSHHNSNPATVEVIFNDFRGKYRRGQVAILPVDVWLLSIRKSVSIINPVNLQFNENATSLDDLFIKEEPKVIEAPKVEEPKKEAPKWSRAPKIEEAPKVEEPVEEVVEAADEPAEESENEE